VNGNIQYIQDIQVNSLNVAFAATPDIHAQQSVLTLSANNRSLSQSKTATLKQMAAASS
jgi:hypothetical protein